MINWPSSLAMEPIKTPDAESTLPPPKKFISEDEMDEIWDARGLKYRVDEFHVAMLNRGLGPYVDREVFRKIFRDIVQAFFVNGEARHDPRRAPRQRFPKVY